MCLLYLAGYKNNSFIKVRTESVYSSQALHWRQQTRKETIILQPLALLTRIGRCFHPTVLFLTLAVEPKSFWVRVTTKLSYEKGVPRMAAAAPPDRWHGHLCGAHGRVSWLGDTLCEQQNCSKSNGDRRCMGIFHNSVLSWRQKVCKRWNHFCMLFRENS